MLCHDSKLTMCMRLYLTDGYVLDSCYHQIIHKVTGPLNNFDNKFMKLMAKNNASFNLLKKFNDFIQ